MLLLVKGSIAFEKYGEASTIPFLLDNLGCNGSEYNLLECLPYHNCESASNENAGVSCLRKGIRT